MVVNPQFRWYRHCPDLLDELPEFAETVKVDGYLALDDAGDDSRTGGIGYRIPGTEYKYKCGPGFELPDHTNPIRNIRCQGSRKIETSEITEICIRKYLESIHTSHSHMSSTICT